MKFGVQQIFIETPKVIKRLQNVINYLLGTALISTDVLTEFFHVNPDSFAKLLGLILIGSNIVLIMFGVKENEADDLQQTRA
ncbi:MAG TPA: hypothetical protein PL045_00675 [Chitinophagaceae bacterium]|nr:hypothetical protein [Chitinophagaceae bacterium]